MMIPWYMAIFAFLLGVWVTEQIVSWGWKTVLRRRAEDGRLLEVGKDLFLVVPKT